MGLQIKSTTVNVPLQLSFHAVQYYSLSSKHTCTCKWHSSH